MREQLQTYSRRLGLNRLPDFVPGSIVGGIVGAMMGFILITVSDPRDGLVLGALEGVLVGGFVAVNWRRARARLSSGQESQVPRATLSLLVLGALTGALLGAMLGWGGALWLPTAVGAGAGWLLGRRLQALPERVEAMPKWLWTLSGRLLDATTVATPGLLLGMAAGAMLGALGGGLLIAGLFWEATRAAVGGAGIGAMVGIIVALMVRRDT